VVSNNGCGVI
jgi:hypothetical protein